MVQGLFNPIVAGIWEREFKGAPEKAQMTLLLWLSPNVSELTLGTYNGSLSRILGLELGSSRPSQFVKLTTINVITDSFIMNDDHNGLWNTIVTANRTIYNALFSASRLYGFLSKEMGSEILALFISLTAIYRCNR
ncbi:hypothetical protein J4E85_000686 [Alternaria conjuncta]|uniref:uncharacterized protein n=1 Tax=Alternaria conjuncta TaxID=181017 RepID=UPI00221FBECD|nr:uncharacterized protein J4E85_000686 [Alternaria conjuncta]KAI4938247.1 hypothetical protein J4E85_000686 [Alternaria conjuncta]